MRPAMARGRRAVVTALAALLVASQAAALRAHPGASTDVSIEWASPSLVRVQLTTSAESLALKLSALAGTPAPSRDARAEIERRRDVLLARLVVAAEDRALAPRWIGLSEPPDPRDRDTGKVVVTLEFDAPQSASGITWQTDLVFGSYLLIVRRDDEDDSLRWLQGRERSALISRTADVAEDWTRTAARAAGQGFIHIVPRGLDHILFVLGLFLLTPALRPLLVQVTAFTVAHSVTLALTAMGVIGLPSSVVEPLIAASIVYVAVENLRGAPLGPTRLALVFGFGLLHGMGFAGVFGSLDLPPATWMTSVVSFNLGVEAGQLAVLAAAAAATRALPIGPEARARWVTRPASILIAATGAFWLVARL